jgi:uncharacterized membrane protein
VSRLTWILSRIRRRLWIRVSLYALLGVVAALLASLSGRFFSGKMPLDVTSEAIDSLLTIIASSMLAVTTFSVGALTSAYAGATSNATPRATPLLTEDEVVQRSLSTFVGSFLFSIVGLIALKVSAYGPEGRAVLFIFTLIVIVLIVVALLRWINQLTKLGRVVDTVSRLETVTCEAMKTRIALPFLGGQVLTSPEQGAQVHSDCVGYVQFVDTAALSEVSEKLQVNVEVHVLPGSFVYHGSVLACLSTLDGPLTDEVDCKIRETFTIGTVRTFDQDPRFGLVVLSEVALRALSPAVNDPGTAIDVIGRQTRLLSYWGDAWKNAEKTPAKYPRVRVSALAYDDLFEDAFNLIGRDGAGQIDVMLRLIKALQALSQTGPAASRVAAHRQLQIALSRAADGLRNDDDQRRLQAAVDAATVKATG